MKAVARDQGRAQPLPDLDLQLLLRAGLIHAPLRALDDGPEALPGPGDRLAHGRRRSRHAHRGLPRHRRQLPASRPSAAGRLGPGGATASTSRAARPRSWTRAAASASPCTIRASQSSGRRSAISPAPRWRRRHAGKAPTWSTCRFRPPARRSSRGTWRRARSASRRCSCSGASSSSWSGGPCAARTRRSSCSCRRRSARAAQASTTSSTTSSSTIWASTT